MATGMAYPTIAQEIPGLTIEDISYAIENTEETMHEFYENQQILIDAMVKISESEGIVSAVRMKDNLAEMLPNYNRNTYNKGMAVITYLSLIDSTIQQLSGIMGSSTYQP